MHKPTYDQIQASFCANMTGVKEFVMRDLLPKCLRCVLLLALTPLNPAQCAHLLLTPFMYQSHINQHIIIGTELLHKGHNVTILLSESFPTRDNIPKEFRILTYDTKHKDFYTIPSDEADDIMDRATRITPIQDLRWHADSFESLCRNPLEDEKLYLELASSKIDLAVVDGFCYSRCYYILLHNLKIPYVSTLTTYEPWIIRSPAIPSFVPFQMSVGPYTSTMTLWEKIHNLFTAVDWAAFPQVSFLEDDFVQEYIKPERNDPPVTYFHLTSNSLLWLIDSDWTMDYPRPTMPNEINIGGLSTQPAKPLSGDILKFVDGAHNGLILVTFGAYDALSPKHADKLLQAFRRIPEHRILMRCSKDLPSELKESIPKHVMISKWVPQNDILGHPNTKLFVTHGGANGQHEALYHAVPLITLPLMADQPYNGLRAQYFGCGLMLNFLSFTSEELVSAVREVIGNRTYSDNIAWRSAAYRGASQTPRERAVWWIEYVMKYGAKHLRAHALDMPWNEYLMLDLVLTLIILPVALITFCLTSLFCCCCRGQSRASRDKADDKKQK